MRNKEEGKIMKKLMEMQGFEIVPDDVEDEIYIRNENGDLVRLEVDDDVEDDPAQ